MRCGKGSWTGGEGYTGAMKSVQLSELGAVAEDVRNGEAVEVRDGEKVVAKVVPVPPIEERIDELVRKGKARRGTGTLPDWFFTAPRSKCEDGSALEQFLADRRKNDW